MADPREIRIRLLWHKQAQFAGYLLAEQLDLGREAGVKIQVGLVHLPGLHQLGFGQTVPVPHSKCTLLDVECTTVGIDVHELGGEVGVRRRRRDIQDDLQRAGHLNALFQHVGGVDEDVIPQLDLGLIVPAGFCFGSRAARVPAQ